MRIIRMTRRSEEGSALLAVIMVSLVLGGLLAAMTLLAVTAAQKSGATRNFTYYSVAADAAVNRALFIANSSQGAISSADYSCNAPNFTRGNWQLVNDVPTAADDPKGTLAKMPSDDADGTVRYAWCTVQTGSNQGLSYDIHAWGFRESLSEPRARHLRIRMESVPVRSTAPGDAGEGVMYEPTAESVFTWGILGADRVRLLGNAAVRSYNSAQTSIPTNDTGEGSIATNKALFYSTDSRFGRIALLNVNDTPASSARERCTGDRCGPSTLKEYSYGIDMKSLDSDIEARCPQDRGPYPDYIASQAGGRYNPNKPNVLSPIHYECYNNMTFDVDTNLGSRFSSGLPAYAYITGDITVKSGVQVNATGTNGGPLALRIYATGNNVTFEQSTTATPTRFVGLIAGNQLTCADNTLSENVVSPSRLVVRGGLSCGDTALGGGSEIWWDKQTTQILDNTGNRNRLWNITEYDEIA